MWLIIALLLIPFSAHSYDRIISLSPQITESIYLLGRDEKIVGVTDFCKRPSGAMKKEKMGTPLRPDVEKIVGMRPDIVFGTREGNSPLVIARLERLKIKTHYFKRPKTFSELIDNFLTLAKLVDKEERGRQIIEIAWGALQKGKGNKGFKVFWQVGAEPLIAASNNSFANDIIVLAGGSNIIRSEHPYPRINAEEVVLKAPHIIVLTDMGYNVELEKERWKRYFSKAQFVAMDAYSVGSPTPISFIDAVNRLAESFR
jgi:iron complex transport system substrate-binding protein